MTNILLNQAIYTVVVLLYTTSIAYKCFANPEPAKFFPEPTTKFIPKNVDEVFTCDECCEYDYYIEACDIFYNFCMTEIFKDGVFMFSKKNFKYQEAIAAATAHFNNKGNTENIILILAAKNKVYFNRKKYYKFKTEVKANINTTGVATAIQKNLDYIDKTKPNSYIEPRIYRNTYDNIYNISSAYITVIKWYNKMIESGDDDFKNKRLITTYYDDKKESCMKKLKPTSIATLKTTLPRSSRFVIDNNKNTITTIKPVIVKTPPISSSVASNNRLFIDVYQKPNYNKNVEENSINLTLVVIASAAAVVVGVMIIAAVCIYKKYNRNKPKVDNRLEGDNKNTKAESIEHIYEDPYAVPYNSMQLAIDNNNDSSNVKLSQSAEHVYIPCINDSECKDSNETLDDINKYINNSSLHERQDIAIQVENDGENTPVYYTLEDNDIIQE